MKKKLLILFLGLVMFLAVGSPIKVSANSEQLYLGGMPAGFSLEVRGAVVVGITDVITENGVESPSKKAGLMAGDVILSIDGVDVNNANDIAKTVTNKEEKTLLIRRNSDVHVLNLIPSLDVSGQYKIGVFIRDNVSGIGTITYIKDNQFASLGHPVIADNGSILEIIGGKLYNCEITGVKRGERGDAGELRGAIFTNSLIGEIKTNKINGVYGTLLDSGIDNDKLIPIEKGNAVIGKASIYSTIRGQSPIEYDISIVKIDQDEEIKNFVIKINDKRLLDTTGGIVQGMSGSPIVQNGKLVGAVTHVFINDPTRGFGISIDNMLNN